MPLRATESAARTRAFDADERRRARRLAPPAQSIPPIELLWHVHGRLLPVNTPIVLCDISTAGFAISSAVPFPEGVVQAFRFLALHGTTPTHLWARVVDVRSADAAGRCRAGCEFLHLDSPHTARVIEGLVRQLIAFLEVDEPTAS